MNTGNVIHLSPPTQKIHKGYKPPCFTPEETAIEKAITTVNGGGAGVDCVEAVINDWIAGLKIRNALHEQGFRAHCMEAIREELSMKTSPVFIVLRLRELYSEQKP